MVATDETQMRRRIIIPAAGDAVRFGGCPKELLPISETDCALTRAVRLAQSLGGVAVVISNPHKARFHEAALKRAGLDGEIVVREKYQHKDLWGSIERGLELDRAGGLILADTVAAIGVDAVTLVPQNRQLVFGCFQTREPGRFSILLPDRIATKEAAAPGNCAWGMVFWDAAVTNFLLGLELDHYDRAFEAAMGRFQWGMFPLEYYYDLGTFAAYRDFLSATDGHR